ncbi:hypothetical protein H5410_064757, partial [Solanum commersonii]
VTNEKGSHSQIRGNAVVNMEEAEVGSNAHAINQHFTQEKINFLFQNGKELLQAFTQMKVEDNSNASEINANAVASTLMNAISDVKLWHIRLGHLPLTSMKNFIGTTNLKHIAKILKKILQFSRRSNFKIALDDWEDEAALLPLPKDVKEGHFVVHAVKSRFVRLLEQAEEEFGFKQEGVLAIPCRHSDLEIFLKTRKRTRNDLSFLLLMLNPL